MSAKVETINSNSQTFMNSVEPCSPIATSTQNCIHEKKDESVIPKFNPDFLNSDNEEEEENCLNTQNLLRVDALLSPHLNFTLIEPKETEAMNMESLRHYCKSLGLSTSGKKETLISRIQNLSDSISVKVINFMKSFSYSTLPNKNTSSDLEAELCHRTNELEKLKIEHQLTKDKYELQVKIINLMNVSIEDKEKIILVHEARINELLASNSGLSQSYLDKNTTTVKLNQNNERLNNISAPPPKKYDMQIIDSSNASSVAQNKYIPPPLRPAMIPDITNNPNRSDKKSIAGKGKRMEERKTTTTKQHQQHHASESNKSGQQSKLNATLKTNKRHPPTGQYKSVYYQCDICGRSNHCREDCFYYYTQRNYDYFYDNHYQLARDRKQWRGPHSSTRLKGCSICYRLNHSTRDCYFNDQSNL